MITLGYLFDNCQLKETGLIGILSNHDQGLGGRLFVAGATT